MGFLAKLFTGGFLAGYRTYLLGIALAAQALAGWAAGDLSLAKFLGALPEILGGMGLIALRAGVDKAAKVAGALEAVGVVPAAAPETTDAAPPRATSRARHAGGGPRRGA